MAGSTKEFRTIMYSVVGDTVVRHKLPFDANDPIGRTKLQKFLARGFTYDDPRLKVKVASGTPEVIVTRVVDLSKPIDGNGEPETITETPVTESATVPGLALMNTHIQGAVAQVPAKKWCNMNAQERRVYQASKKEVANDISGN